VNSKNWPVLSAARLKLRARDKRVGRAGTDDSARADVVNTKLAELRAAQEVSDRAA
jgi:hypothetical protein